MKVSERIQVIVEQAEAYFGVSEHINDTISVDCYVTSEGWQIALNRPTQRELERGEVVDHTCKTVEAHIVFQSYDHPTLIAALEHLQFQLDGVTTMDTREIEHFYRR